MENNQVTFRRINGRIVPIKPKTAEERKRRNFGIGAMAAGAAAAAVGQRAEYAMKAAAGRAESIFRKSGYSIKRAQNRKFLFRAGEPSLFDFARRQKGAEKLFNVGVKAGKKAEKLRKLAPYAKSIGIWTGASLIGSGMARVFESKDEDNFEGTVKELGFTAASAAAIYGGGDKALRAKAGRFLAKVLSRGKIK